MKGAVFSQRKPYEGDYGGVIRGAGEGEYFSPPSSFGVQRKVVVPAGTLVIMFYDTWHWCGNLCLAPF